MGSGVAKQVRERYPHVFHAYHTQCNNVSSHVLLGQIQLIPIAESKYIVNLFAQDTYGYDGKCYTNYEALNACLTQVRSMCSLNHTIAFPYLMSCARGGGDWNIVYKMIEDIFKDYDGDILICEYDGK